MLIADLTVPTTSTPYMTRPDIDLVGAGLRMSRMYWDRYPWILDWSNMHGKTALHMAALKGNEELAEVRDPPVCHDFSNPYSALDALRSWCGRQPVGQQREHAITLVSTYAR